METLCLLTVPATEQLELATISRWRISKSKLLYQHTMKPPTKHRRRTENLMARTAAKVERRKEKREKKLLRPGFEGRRESFIRSPSAGGSASRPAVTAAST